MCYALLKCFFGADFVFVLEVAFFYGCVVDFFCYFGCGVADLVYVVGLFYLPFGEPNGFVGFGFEGEEYEAGCA